MSTDAVAVRARSWARTLHWYLREVSGEADYDRYLARHRDRHGDAACALSRAEFERQRWEERERNPGTRCC